MAFQRCAREDPTFDKLFGEFLNGTDEQRCSRFKYLPRLDVAPSFVLSGVRMMGGEKPTMLCKKLKSHFFRGNNYIEIDIDVASSSVARGVTGMILPKITAVVVSHAFILEGHSEDELPERILGCFTTQYVDLRNTVRISPGK